MLLVHKGGVCNGDFLVHDSMGSGRVCGAMQRESLVSDLGVLNRVLGLRLDHVEELVVLVLDVVLQLIAVVVHNSVHNRVENRSNIMVHLSNHCSVVATAPERLSMDMVVLECSHLGMDGGGDAPVYIAIMVCVPLVVSRVQITSAQHELTIGNMRIKHFVLVVVVRVCHGQAFIECYVFVMDLALGVGMVESTVLVSPEEFVVGGEQRH